MVRPVLRKKKSLTARNSLDEYTAYQKYRQIEIKKNQKGVFIERFKKKLQFWIISLLNKKKDPKWSYADFAISHKMYDVLRNDYFINGRYSLNLKFNSFFDLSPTQYKNEFDSSSVDKSSFEVKCRPAKIIYNSINKEMKLVRVSNNQPSFQFKFLRVDSVGKKFVFILRF